MKPQFANMTREEFLKEMQPYLTPDRYAHLSPEELKERAARFRNATIELKQLRVTLQECITERDN